MKSWGTRVSSSAELCASPRPEPRPFQQQSYRPFSWPWHHWARIQLHIAAGARESSGTVLNPKRQPPELSGACSSQQRRPCSRHQMRGWLPTKQNNSLHVESQELRCIVLTAINHGSVAENKRVDFKEREDEWVTATLPAINYHGGQLQTTSSHFLLLMALLNPPSG